MTALSAMTAGARRRGGPLPRGGPAAVDADVRRALGTAGVGDLFPHDTGASAADVTAAAHFTDASDALRVQGPHPAPSASPAAGDVHFGQAHPAAATERRPGGYPTGGAPTVEFPGAAALGPPPAGPSAADASHPQGFATGPHPAVPHPHAATDTRSAPGPARPAARHVADPLPTHGVGAHQALAALTEALAHGSADPADPLCAGHLHCPPLAVAVVADAVAAALNPSLDSWDQAPAATALETEVVAALAGLVGFDPAVASGTVTTGGTESNLLGLLLARDRSGPGVGRHRVLCSDAAHFSVRRSAVLLGLGDDAVVPVATGLDHRIDPGALDAVCRRVAAANDLPTAIVATAGTTDFGAVDPLAACADVAREHGAWLHVDAAYGGGALFSDRLAPLLHGLDRADSVGLDLHKLGWQPVAAGVFLVRDRRLFAPLTQRAKYLNPADDEDAGFPSLLGHSPRTTRRADVFKIAVTLRALGRAGLGALVDRCHELARYAGERIDRDPGPGALELTAEPVLTTVVFRYVPEERIGESPAARSDTVNAELRRRLLAEGRAVVGRTDVGPGPGAVRLKLTLLNPHAAEHDVDAVLRAVIDAGRAVEREL
ncbi:pyridoxal-dependent decarboxylase [Uniformispora flossi]|uniref:pyridoxal phosphate-dependent decarboxylase family protein n=1 Tax=Uniformispora flossi TaxID=3390723 RepID=UPI003C2FC34D